ncbi:MAG: FAD:protein FMN transferase [Planctomycetota bacterium]|nr:MAG: FAD:protein FMN transferase [Planctomycetota bacterium]
MIVRLAAEAMATRFELVLSGTDELFLRAAGEEALEIIRDQHARLSVFDRGSLVSRINALAASRPVEVDRELWELLDLCARIWRQSGGAFDPAVGSLMARWGFRDSVPGKPRTPAPAGFEAVELDRTTRTIRFLDPRVSLDFGAIAKGFALDLARRSLCQLGVERALLHGGTSSAIAIGTPDDLPAWTIEIPSRRSGVTPLRAQLADSALSISSPSGRVVNRAGQAVGHIMDPRTGRPTSGVSVSAVSCASAAEADAWSTALIVCSGRPASMRAASATLAQEGTWIIEPEEQHVFVPAPSCKGD